MLAEEKGLDLVEIAATATPPVCRIMNSGKYFYQQAKREAEARKHQRHIQIKEVKFRPKIDEHDFQFKLRNVERFLAGGSKVKSLVTFRGREIVHAEIGREILQRLAAELGEAVLVESPPRQEGNTMVQILAPRKEAVAAPKAKAKAKAKQSAKSKVETAKVETAQVETAAPGAEEVAASKGKAR